MHRALRELTVEGVETSREFHLQVMENDEFRRGDISIQWLEQRLPEITHALTARPYQGLGLQGLVPLGFPATDASYLLIYAELGAVGLAAFAVLLVVLLPLAHLNSFVVASSLLLLTGLGAVAARLGGAPLLRGAARVTFWGAVAMGCSALVGHLFGAVV